MNYAQIKAIEQKNKERWKQINDQLTEDSGIYILTREENGIKFGYIGQAKHILTRLAQHLSGYQQYIDLSLKKHGLYSKDNPTGWSVFALNCEESQLDRLEREYIAAYANMGFQMRNKTVGGQDEGKTGLDNQKPSRGYRDGLAQGYKNAQTKIQHLFELYLDYKPKNDKSSKNQEKAIKKFVEFLGGEENEKQ